MLPAGQSRGINFGRAALIVNKQRLLYLDNMNANLGPGPRIRPVPAVTRAVAILRQLDRAGEPMGVNAIARSLGLVPSTCLHILRALVEEELVAFDPATKRYSPEAGIVSLARRALRRDNFSGLVQPELDRLARQHGLTTIGVRVVGLEHMIVVAISHADIGLRLHVDLGSRFPALISATGRCLAAFSDYPEQELARRFERLRWHRAPSLERWRAEIAETATTGFSVDQGDYIEGISILSVPVLDRAGAMTHGLVAIGVVEQVRRLGPERLAGELRTIVDRL